MINTNDDIKPTKADYEVLLAVKEGIGARHRLEVVKEAFADERNRSNLLREALKRHVCQHLECSDVETHAGCHARAVLEGLMEIDRKGIRGQRPSDATSQGID